MRLVPALSHDSSSGKTAAGSGRSMANLADENTMVPDRGPARRRRDSATPGSLPPGVRPPRSGGALSALDGSAGDQHLVALVAVVELVPAQVAGAESLQERR